MASEVSEQVIRFWEHESKQKLLSDQKCLWLESEYNLLFRPNEEIQEELSLPLTLLSLI